MTWSYRDWGPQFLVIFWGNEHSAKRYPGPLSTDGPSCDEDTASEKTLHESVLFICSYFRPNFFGKIL
jgi:hypothetical protein